MYSINSGTKYTDINLFNKYWGISVSREFLKSMLSSIFTKALDEWNNSQSYYNLFIIIRNINDTMNYLYMNDRFTLQTITCTLAIYRELFNPMLIGLDSYLSEFLELGRLYSTREEWSNSSYSSSMDGVLLELMDIYFDVTELAKVKLNLCWDDMEKLYV